jgi:hypothetical protein
MPSAVNIQNGFRNVRCEKCRASYRGYGFLYYATVPGDIISPDHGDQRPRVRSKCFFCDDWTYSEPVAFPLVLADGTELSLDQALRLPSAFTVRVPRSKPPRGK